MVAKDLRTGVTFLRGLESYQFRVNDSATAREPTSRATRGFPLN
jgi:hypothetical protein